MAEISRQEAVQYLLGEGTEAEREALELRVLRDEALAEEVEIFENELVDDYVAGRLAGAERARFERSYLVSPDRSEKVAFARALQRRFGAGESAGSPRLPHWLGLAAAVLMGIAGTYFAYRFNQTRRELDRLAGARASLERRERELSDQLARTQAEQERLEKELQSLRKEAESSASEATAARADLAGTVSFTLTGGLSREAGTPTVLKIPAVAKQVRLSMPLPPDPYASYSAEIRTPEGKRIWKGAGLAARRAGAAFALDLTVPARLLQPGDYILSLTGSRPGRPAEGAADFVFRIQR